jgi:uncharacterized protein YbgA (DUF1722 family)
LALDNDGRGFVGLWLRGQGVSVGRLKELDWEDGMDFHVRWKVQLISLCSNAFQNLERIMEIVSQFLAGEVRAQVL